MPVWEPNMKRKLTVSERLGLEALAEIIAFCAEHRGTVARIHRAYQRACWRKINRSVVEGWLKSDRLKRHQPLLGSGLLLIRVATEEIEKIKLALALNETRRDA